MSILLTTFGNFIFRPIQRSLPDAQVPWRLEQTWTVKYNPNLIGKDRLPVGDQSFALTPGQLRPEPSTLHHWEWNFSVRFLMMNAPPPGDQFYDLVPRPPAPLLQTWLLGTTALTMPVVTTGVTLRSPLYTQHVQPVLLQTWLQPTSIQLLVAPAKPTAQYDWPLTPAAVQPERSITAAYNPNLVGQDRLPIGEQVSDLTPRPFEYHAQLRDWRWNYNLNLIGKDRLPVGEIVYDLAPRSYESPTQLLRTWEWSYNRNLIAQDRLPAGEQVYDLVPSQRPPEQVQLHAWQWNYNLNLIGRDRLPFRQQDWPVPPPVTWYQSWAVFQLGELELEVPFRQLDWPNPIQPYRLDQTYTTSYNKNLIAQDAMLVGEQTWALPAQPDYHAQLRTWLQSLNPVLITVFKPFAQYDWPLTPAPAQPERSITASYNKNLIAQDRMVTGEQVTDLPPRDFARLFQTWIQTVNLALTTAPESLLSYGKQLWELAPRGYPEEPKLHSWEFSYNKNLIAQDQLPFRQGDWPNPVTPVQAKDWIQSTNIALLAVQKPFAQYDWPLTSAAQQPDRAISTSYLKTLIGQDRLPSGKGFFDLAPRGPQPIEQTQAVSYLKTLIGQDRLPNRQLDWPLSPGHITQLLQVTPAGTITLRFPVVPLPPGAIFTGRPELGPAPLLQAAVYNYNQAFIPAPTAPTLILRTLMGTGV